MASKTRKKKGRPSKAEEEAKKFVETVTSLLSSYAAANPLDAIYRAEYLTKLIDQELERPVNVPPPIRGEHNVSVTVDLSKHQEATKQLMRTFLASDAFSKLYDHVKQLHGKVKDFQGMLTNVPAMMTHFLFGVPGGLGAIFHALAAIASSVGKMANNEQVTQEELEQGLEYYNMYANYGYDATKTQIPYGPSPVQFAKDLYNVVKKSKTLTISKDISTKHLGDFDGWLKDYCTALWGADYGTIVYTEIEKALRSKPADFYMGMRIDIESHVLVVEPTDANVKVGDSIMVSAWCVTKFKIWYTTQTQQEKTLDVEVNLPIYCDINVYGPDGPVKTIHIASRDAAYELRDKGIEITLSKAGTWSVQVHMYKPLEDTRTVTYKATGKEAPKVQLRHYTREDLIKYIAAHEFPHAYYEIGVKFLEEQLKPKLPPELYLENYEILETLFVAYADKKQVESPGVVHITAFWRVKIKIRYTVNPDEHPPEDHYYEVKLGMIGEIDVGEPTGYTDRIRISTFSASKRLVDGEFTYNVTKVGEWAFAVVSSMPWFQMKNFSVQCTSSEAASPGEAIHSVQRQRVRLTIKATYVNRTADYTYYVILDHDKAIHWSPYWFMIHADYETDVKHGEKTATYEYEILPGTHRLHVYRLGNGEPSKATFVFNDQVAVEVEMGQDWSAFTIEFTIDKSGDVSINSVEPHQCYLAYRIFKVSRTGAAGGTRHFRLY